MWKVYGRLNGIGRLHGNSSSGIYVYTCTWVGTIALDGFQFVMAIYSGWYINLDIPCMISNYYNFH